jgi:hypothetical protein
MYHHHGHTLVSQRAIAVLGLLSQYVLASDWNSVSRPHSHNEPLNVRCDKRFSLKRLANRMIRASLLIVDLSARGQIRPLALWHNAVVSSDMRNKKIRCWLHLMLLHAILLFNITIDAMLYSACVHLIWWVDARASSASVRSRALLPVTVSEN